MKNQNIETIKNILEAIKSNLEGHLDEMTKTVVDFQLEENRKLLGE